MIMRNTYLQGFTVGIYIKNFKYFFLRLTNTQPDIIGEFLRDLYSRGLVKYLDNGANWIRNIVNFQDETTHGLNFINKIKLNKSIFN